MSSGPYGPIFYISNQEHTQMNQTLHESMRIKIQKCRGIIDVKKMRIDNQ